MAHPIHIKKWTSPYKIQTHFLWILLSGIATDKDSTLTFSYMRRVTLNMSVILAQKYWEDNTNVLISPVEDYQNFAWPGMLDSLSGHHSSISWFLYQINAFSTPFCFTRAVPGRIAGLEFVARLFSTRGIPRGRFGSDQLVARPKLNRDDIQLPY